MHIAHQLWVTEVAQGRPFSRPKPDHSEQSKERTPDQFKSFPRNFQVEAERERDAVSLLVAKLLNVALGFASSCDLCCKEKFI